MSFNNCCWVLLALSSFYSLVLSEGEVSMTFRLGHVQIANEVGSSLSDPDLVSGTEFTAVSCLRQPDGSSTTTVGITSTFDVPSDYSEGIADEQLGALSEIIQPLINQLKQSEIDPDPLLKHVLVDANGIHNIDDESALSFAIDNPDNIIEGDLTITLQVEYDRLYDFIRVTLREQNSKFLYDPPQARSLLKIIANIERRHSALSPRGKAFVLLLSQTFRVAFNSGNDPDNLISSISQYIWPIAPTCGFKTWFQALSSVDLDYIRSQTILPSSLRNIFPPDNGENNYQVVKGLLSVITTSASSSKTTFLWGRDFGTIDKLHFPNLVKTVNRNGFSITEPLSVFKWLSKVTSRHTSYDHFPMELDTINTIDIYFKGIPHFDLSYLIEYSRSFVEFVSKFHSRREETPEMREIHPVAHTPQDEQDEEFGIALQRNNRPGLTLEIPSDFDYYGSSSGHPEETGVSGSSRLSDEYSDLTGDNPALFRQSASQAGRSLDDAVLTPLEELK